MGKSARSVQMIKASWAVLRSGKGLALFPILSGVVSVIVAVSFLTPAVVMSADGTVRPVSIVLFGLFYLVTAYVTIFFNAALVSQANVALAGGTPSVGAGLKAAGTNWLRILPWALMSATVSVIIRVIEERLGFLGRVVALLIGMTWSLVTFLVLPVLVIEKVGVRTAVRRSSDLFKRTWGENMAGSVGLTMLTGLALLPTIGLFAYGVYAKGATLLVCAALAIAWLLVVMVVAAAMSGIYQTALYRYAAGHETARFGNVDLGQAFRARRASGRRPARTS